LNLHFDDYVSDKKGKFAVVKNLEIIGEASYKLTKEFREQHPFFICLKIKGGNAENPVKE
jgi:uncharacterized protein with HEPN domain